MSNMKWKFPNGVELSFADFEENGGKVPSEMQENLAAGLDKSKAEKGGSKSKLVDKMKKAVPESRGVDKPSKKTSDQERLRKFMESKDDKGGKK